MQFSAVCACAYSEIVSPEACVVLSAQDPSFTPSIENIAAAPDFTSELKHRGFTLITASNLVQAVVNSC